MRVGCGKWQSAIEAVMAWMKRACRRRHLLLAVTVSPLANGEVEAGRWLGLIVTFVVDDATRRDDGDADFPSDLR